MINKRAYFDGVEEIGLCRPITPKAELERYGELVGKLRGRIENTKLGEGVVACLYAPEHARRRGPRRWQRHIG